MWATLTISIEIHRKVKEKSSKRIVILTLHFQYAPSMNGKLNKHLKFIGKLVAHRSFVLCFDICTSLPWWNNTKFIETGVYFSTTLIRSNRQHLISIDQCLLSMSPDIFHSSSNSLWTENFVIMQIVVYEVVVIGVFLSKNLMKYDVK